MKSLVLILIVLTIVLTVQTQTAVQKVYYHYKGKGSCTPIVVLSKKMIYKGLRPKLSTNVFLYKISEKKNNTIIVIHEISIHSINP